MRAFSKAALATISAFAFVMRRRFPYISVGWFWYLICLVPVIGLVQVGLQGHADRYTYLSQIGLCIVVTWSVSDLLGSFSKRREILVGVTAIFIGLLTWRGWIQTSYWRNTQSLWAHVLEVQPASDLAHYNIAADLLSQNRVDDAIAHYKKALAARQGKGRSPYQLSSAIIHNALGNAFAQKECYDDALVQYRAAVECDPNFADAHSNVATLLTRRGDISGALAESEKALSIPPEDAPSHVRLGTLLLQSGRESFALAHYRRALELDPESRDAATGISQCSQLASSKVR